MYKTHRVIWLIVYGVWAEEIDHEDGNGLNNKLANLKCVSRIENQRNKRLSYKNNSHIVTGKQIGRAHV